MVRSCVREISELRIARRADAARGQRSAEENAARRPSRCSSVVVVAAAGLFTSLLVAPDYPLQSGAARPILTAIGIATSSDGIKWTKNPGNPVLTPSPDSTYDSVYNSSESVIRDGDIYRLYYAGRIDTIHKYFSIGLATKAGKLVPP